MVVFKNKNPTESNPETHALAVVSSCLSHRVQSPIRQTPVLWQMVTVCLSGKFSEVRWDLTRPGGGFESLPWTASSVDVFGVNSGETVSAREGRGTPDGA